MDQKSLFKLITDTGTHTLPDLERITRGRPTGHNENGRLPNMAYNDAKNRMAAYVTFATAHVDPTLAILHMDETAANQQSNICRAVTSSILLWHFHATCIRGRRPFNHEISLPLYAAITKKA